MDLLLVRFIPNFPTSLSVVDEACLFKGSWDEAYELANKTVAQMTMDEKLGIIIGTGQLNSARMPTFIFVCGP